MPTKLGRKQMPTGYNATDFKYMGRPANDQDDFGDDVGVADTACVNQFGEANNSKGYHGGVVKAADGTWWVYLEWGRISPGKSWNGAFAGQDFQFVQCSDEAEARKFFQKQLRSKNIKRLEQRKIAGKTRWVGRNGKDGYFVQRLATRENGLPDAYTIKDNTGVTVTASSTPKKAPKKTAPARTYQPQVIALAQDLVGGTRTYARSLTQATGVVPTMAAIEEVRGDILPAALKLLAKIGNDAVKQLGDRDLQDLSKYTATIVPRPIPRTGDASAIILSSANIAAIQLDLDLFESALKGEDFSTSKAAPTVDVDAMLGRSISWVDPNSTLGRFVAETFRGMTRNRHGDLRSALTIKNIYAVKSPRADAGFEAEVVRMAGANRARRNSVAAGLQPNRRVDLADIGDHAAAAGVFIGIHGTRGVNVAPILQSNLRLPKSLSGVHITGAAFGHGIYFATDWKKSHGYTGHSRRWGNGGGSISGRGFFMFLADVAGGQFFYPRSAWSINSAKCPSGGDSVYAHPSKIGSLANDEHVIFDARHQRIRYIIEGQV